jgi:secreted PhoX family phosphatase
MTTIDRRTVLKGAAAAGVAAFAGPFSGFITNPTALAKPDFRNLRAIPDLRDGVVRLHLPEGFQYRSFHDTAAGAVFLDDGTRLPGRHDGMAAFAGPNGNVILVRNHEINGPGAPFGNAALAYDAQGRGGTTTVEVTNFGEVVHAFTSLNGTQNNCAGGRTPWNSWITCEETVNGPDVGPDFTGAPNVALTRRHGFIYEVPAGGQSTLPPATST